MKKYCKCGCGKEIAKNRTFIHGHNSRGSHMAEKTKLAHSLRMKENNPSCNPIIREKINKTMKERGHCLASSLRMKENNPMMNPLTVQKATKNRIKNGFCIRASKRMKENNPMKNPNFSEKAKKSWRKKVLKIWHSDPTKTPNWKGGIAIEEYCDAWADKEFKNDIKIRDKNHCMNPKCKKISKKMAIHHIDYNKQNCHPKNLITLCFSCNAIANGNREKWESFYNKIIEEKYYYE